MHPQIDGLCRSRQQSGPRNLKVQPRKQGGLNQRSPRNSAVLLYPLRARRIGVFLMNINI